MAVSVNEASAVLRAAVRDTIRKRSLLFLIQGGVMVLAGVVALIFPAFMSTGLLSLLGWLLILSGIVQVVSLIGATQVPYFWLQLITVVLEVMVGYLLVSNPAAGLVAVTFLMLVLFLVDGFARIVFALMIRPMGDWLWVLASGLVAVACAMVLFTNLPEAASWLLGFLLGIHLISAGGALGFSPGGFAATPARPLSRPEPRRLRRAGRRGRPGSPARCLTPSGARPAAATKPPAAGRFMPKSTSTPAGPASGATLVTARPPSTGGSETAGQAAGRRRGRRKSATSGSWAPALR